VDRKCRMDLRKRQAWQGNGRILHKVRSNVAWNRTGAFFCLSRSFFFLGLGASWAGFRSCDGRSSCSHWLRRHYGCNLCMHGSTYLANQGGAGKLCWVGETEAIGWRALVSVAECPLVSDLVGCLVSLSLGHFWSGE
jgi:hypothetical protein